MKGFESHSSDIMRQHNGNILRSQKLLVCHDRTNLRRKHVLNVSPKEMLLRL